MKTTSNTISSSSNLKRTSYGNESHRKTASDSLMLTMKTLQRAIYDTDRQTDEVEARLLDLSIKADITVAANIRTTEEIFGILGSVYTDQDEKHVACQDDTGVALSTSMKRVDRIEAAVRTIVDQLQLHQKNLASFYDKRSREAQNYRLEAERLAKYFNTVNEQGRDEDIKRYWVAKELESLCQSMSDALSMQTNEGNEALDAILFGSEMPATNHPLLLHIRDVDPEEFIRGAWVEEQLNILQHQEIQLDQSVSQIQEILKPLEPLHNCLEGVATQVQEAEAVLEAFGEEMEEIDLSFTTSTARPIDQHDLDRKLLQTLQKFRDDGSFDALDLRSCTNQDVINELVLLKSRLTELQVQEKDWATKGIDALAVRPIHRDLPSIYSNSPMNTSPPFAMSQTASKLQEQTQSKAAKVSETTNELERNVRESLSKSSNLKRLDAFIEHWTQ
ncbi:hypothetical protein BJ165DRAFT_588422 [Panaeolus papilionaceus]|nr:hypothetical protein BJ165DRAFT_588422 [Panaeolus papilionaceus]